MEIEKIERKVENDKKFLKTMTVHHNGWTLKYYEVPSTGKGFLRATRNQNGVHMAKTFGQDILKALKFIKEN